MENESHSKEKNKRVLIGNIIQSSNSWRYLKKLDKLKAEIKKVHKINCCKLKVNIKEDIRKYLRKKNTMKRKKKEKLKEKIAKMKNSEGNRKFQDETFEKEIFRMLLPLYWKDKKKEDSERNKWEKKTKIKMTKRYQKRSQLKKLVP